MKLVMFIIIILSKILIAGDDFVFENIAAEDWKVTEDPENGIQDAVILFEKVDINDEKLIDEKCYYSIYRRIRILSHNGRSQGDVTTPFLSRDQKVEEIKGRTILPDGKEFYLHQDKILDKEVFKYQDLKVRQKYFHVPRVTDNCIIEYYIKIRLKYPKDSWLMERDIYLKHGEVNWKFYKGKGLSQTNYTFLQDFVTPNYIWFNTSKKLDVEFYPSLKEPDEVHFSVDDIAPFEDEIYTLPDLALKANLRYYYGTNDAPAAFWGNQGDKKERYFREFTKKDSEIKNIINEFDYQESVTDKINSAYNWIQKNIKKTQYDDDEDYDDNEHINDVLKHRYGDATDIDLLFYDILRELNIDAKIAYVVDRDENIFEEQAKYWQFDRSIVVVKNSDDRYTYYDPSTKYLTAGSLLWYNEGISAFVIGSLNENFINTPFSGFRENHTTRMLTMRMEEDQHCEGILTDQIKGHPARDLRMDLDETTELDKRSQLKDHYKTIFPNGKIDSIQVGNLTDPEKNLVIKANIEIPKLGYSSLDRIVLKISDILGSKKNEFLSEKRDYPVLFNYASEVVDIIQVVVPMNYSIEYIPEEQLISNRAGVCQVKVNTLNQDSIIIINRLFRLEKPYFQKDEYKGLRYLFQMRDYFSDAVIILKKKSESPGEKSL